jgi:hypothetical protein
MKKGIHFSSRVEIIYKKIEIKFKIKVGRKINKREQTKGRKRKKREE